MESSISYTVIRDPRRKRLAVVVTAAAEVVVKAPERASKRSIEQLVRESTPWILQAQARARQRSASVGAVRLAEGETLPLLGRECPIQTAEAPAFADGVFYLSGVSREEQLREVAAIYTRIAEDLLPRLVERYAAQLGVHPTAVKIGKAARSWGYCKKDGSLHFTWRLLCHDPAFVEYVVVHELCHLLYFDHSPAFWASVERVIPNRKELEKSERVRQINLRLQLLTAGQ